jgi:uncharacterized protein YjbI with pentapeptide repeats
VGGIHAWQPGQAADADLIEKLVRDRSCVDCDLSGADLRRYDLAGVNLAGADLSDVNFFQT